MADLMRTYAAEVAWLQANAKSGKGTFCADMLNRAKWGQGWTPNMLTAIRKGMERDAAKATAQATMPAPEKIADAGALAQIKALFTTAQSRLKKPAILLDAGSAGTVRLSLAGPKAKVQGSIVVTENGTGYGLKYWGSITPSGEWRPAYGTPTPDDLGTILKAFAADPAGVAADYGRKTGHCFACSKALSDPRSLAVGYGAICAGHWQLPYPKLSELACVAA